MVTWFVLGVLGVLIFIRGRDGAAKQRMWPQWVVSTAILFIIFVLWIVGPSKGLWIFLPVAVLSSFLGIKFVRFCTACGRYLAGPFASAPRCPYCKEPNE